MESILKFLQQSGFYQLFETGFPDWLKTLAMLGLACVLLYLAIVKKFEPMLLLPIAFGMMLSNLPGAGMYHPELFTGGHVAWEG
ncbi:MAG: sodium ion-translocating decarboxylase subunit beta, partial [Clostridia bacterium]|nr:sodium ion-translocating decarboxylase subunit beta [Clostridia bacterium]